MTNMKISVFGMGRVGLPFALFLAEKGHSVIGVDIDREKICKLNSCIFPFIEDHALELLKKHAGKNFLATNDQSEAVSKSEYIIITIGTPVDDRLNPLLSPLTNLLSEIIPKIKPGQTIILRSTIFPGGTEYTKRFIEEKSGLKIGEDIFLAFCPERIAEGKTIEELPVIPQIIGAFDEESLSKSEELFKTVTNLIHKTSPKKAELAKLFSNMYRYINFAIGNQFMVIAEENGEDISEIVKLVNEGYKRGGLCSPGFSAGPCLYKDGFFLVEGQPYPELITSSWRINEGMPGYLIKKILKQKELYNKKVVILGKGFKKDTDDIRNSLSFKAKKIFESNYANVLMHDPLVPPSENFFKIIEKADVLFVGTNHSFYQNLNMNEIKMLVNPNCLIVDIWNIFKKNKIFFNINEIAFSYSNKDLDSNDLVLNEKNTSINSVPSINKNDIESSKKKVVVTGSKGFIMGYVIEKLLQKGYHVVGIDNLSKYGDVEKSYDNNPNYKFILGDAKDVNLLKENLKDAEHFICGAAMIGGISYFHEFAYDLLAENERITASSFDAAIWAHKNSKLKKITVLSSSMIYESTESWPSKEGDEFKVAPPKSTYGFQKLAVEYFCKGAWEQYGLPYTIICPFNAVGIGEGRAKTDVEIKSGNIKLALGHVIPDLVQKILKNQDPLHILGSGNQIRHYTYAGDLADGIIGTLENQKTINESFNISTGKGHSVKELAEIIWKKIKPGEPLKLIHDEPFPYDVQKRVPSVEKARNILNFSADTTLDKSLNEVIPWIREMISKGKI
jgi:UDP-glucose 4-epimerase